MDAWSGSTVERGCNKLVVHSSTSVAAGGAMRRGKRGNVATQLADTKAASANARATILMRTSQETRGG